MNDEIEMNKETESKIERIKKHLKENKQAYITASCGIATGAVCFALGAYSRGKTPTIVNKNINIVKPVNEVLVRVSQYGNKLGRPGKAIYDVTDNMKEYKSISRAAEHLGLSAGNISNQLHGRTSHVNGHKFMWA